MSAPRILIMAGGTGGHIFPALAVARELTARGSEVFWLGTRHGLEAELVPKAGFPVAYIDVTGLRGKGSLGWALAPLRLVRALWQAVKVLRRLCPGAVLGMGGFVTGPGGVAARLLGRPLIIHEQNAVAGLTNRLLAPLAGRVLEAFPGTFRRGAQAIGNPVRAEIGDLPLPARRFAERNGPLRLLVLGGSQGALALNQVVPEALAALPEPLRPEVRHQTGRRHLAAVREHYEACGVRGEVLPFLDDMAAAYGWADLVVCRAGALTISELAAAGLGAILVPFPHAVDDHQTRNARFLVDAGAALLAPQATLDARRLAGLLESFCADPEAGRRRLCAMAEAARGLACPEATRQVADLCLAAAGEVRV